MTTAATRAAIKRASAQAREAMRLHAGQVEAELVLVYEQAAEEVRGRLAAAVDAGLVVPVARLRDLLRQVEDVLAALADARAALLGPALDVAAALGVQPFTFQGVAGVAGAGAGAQAVLEGSAAMRVSREAVAFVVDFVAADGLKLSDRLWRLDQGAKERLGRAIGQAVVQGWDAQKAAAQFMYAGTPVPTDVAARLAGAQLPALVRNADLLIGADGANGGELWQAQRVFRTEINRAHGMAYMAGAAQTPGFAGFRFLLSPQHPKADICDLLAAQNLYGLGAGVYPTAALCPWPAHPNTLSFVVAVFDDEVTAADRAGRETVTDAMARMSSAVREGILGVAKAELYDRGQVKTWQFRSPLRAVRARLERQGA